MQIRRFWAVLASLACSSYSYSDGLVFGQSPNAAAAGYNWVMTNILPKQAGLEVNGVVYRYTTVKKAEDDMIVSIQNLNALGSGYIFRSVDDWSKIPGNTIQKSVPVTNIPIQYWGDGSIDVNGEGEVKNASVIYTYQYDPCFDPQSGPFCPGYRIPVEYIVETAELRDPLDDEYLRKELERKADIEDEEEKDKQRKRIAEQRQTRGRLEIALSAVNTALMTAEAELQAADFFASAELPRAYDINIPGGVYNDTVRLVDSRLPDNSRGLRANWAQQLLHEKMIDLQYENLNTKED
jgi:hypothetical protein